MQVLPRSIISVLLFLVLTAAPASFAEQPNIQPFVGLRYEPTFKQGEFLAYSDAGNYWGPQRLEDKTAARRVVGGIEIYPGGKTYQERTPFLTLGLLFGKTNGHDLYREPGEDFSFEASRISRETGLMLGLGLRQRALKFAFTYYYIDLDSEVSTFSTYGQEVNFDYRWRASVESQSISRHLFAPSLTATVLRVLDIRLEGWYELDYENRPVSGSYSSSEDLATQGPSPFSYQSSYDDFNYAIQITLNLAAVAEHF